MQIQLETKLGSIALAIAAECGAGERIGRLAMQQVVFHVAPGKAFKKGSGYAREDAWSAKLEAQVQGAVEAALTDAGFSKVSVEGSRYVAQASKTLRDQKAILEAAGVSEAKIKELLPSLFQNEVENAETADSDEEAVD